MVDQNLIVELMKMFSANPETFPRVLSAFVRKELLALTQKCDEQIELIRQEKEESRRQYTIIHLEDLITSLSPLEEFLGYFRDVPLGRNEDSITRGDDVRIMLGDICSYASNSVEKVSGRGLVAWKFLDESEFEELKAEILRTAKDVRSAIVEIDESLALNWLESDTPESE